MSFRIDFTTSNINDVNLNKFTPDKLPDVVRTFTSFCTLLFLIVKSTLGNQAVSMKWEY